MTNNNDGERKNCFFRETCFFRKIEKLEKKEVTRNKKKSMDVFKFRKIRKKPNFPKNREIIQTPVRISLETCIILIFRFNFNILYIYRSFR